MTTSAKFKQGTEQNGRQTVNHFADLNQIAYTHHFSSDHNFSLS